MTAVRFFFAIGYLFIVPVGAWLLLTFLENSESEIQQLNQDLKAMIDLLYGKWETLAKEKEELAVV